MWVPSNDTELKVQLRTSYGIILIQLFRDKSPATVDNFLQYVRDGFYSQTIFHRVVDDFVIQGGGFEQGMIQKTTRPPILNEAKGGMRNARATIAMARQPNNPHSATSQFFINTRNNDMLDHVDETPEGWGYCVFGRVVDGMEAVEKIEGVATTTLGDHQDVPTLDVMLEQVETLK